MERMGERIRNRRENLNIQINDLATTISVTPSLISQIERAKAFPSIVTLKKIADALQTTVGNLIGENDTYTKKPVVTYSERKLVQSNSNGTTLYLLSHHDQQKVMEPHLIVFPPDGNSENLINAIAGQSFYHVLQGSLKIEMNFHTYLLDQGDSFYFNARYKHTIYNIGGMEANLLWISSHPTL